MSEAAKTWIVRGDKPAQATMRLFCLPSAGASATMFQAWQDRLSPAIEVVGLQPPGRGRRVGEPPFQRMVPLIDAAREAIEAYLDRRFAVFGYSAGAPMAFELARRLQSDGIDPEHLFVAACRAPHLPGRQPGMHTLPDTDFKHQLAKMGGTPPEVLEHKELMAHILPTIRADYAVIETYRPTRSQPLNCRVTAFGGLRDPIVPPEELAAWREHTHAQFEQIMIPADHFFFEAAQDCLLSVIRRRLGVS
jgi:surfactin synthase thioesterase subunit